MKTAFFWFTWAVLATVNLLWEVSTESSCGSLFHMQTDHFLFGHVLHAAVVSDEFQCHLKCLGSRNCTSFNVHPAESGGNGRICELNNETRQTKPSDFKKRKRSNYYGPVKISCVDVSTHKSWHQKNKCNHDRTAKRGANPNHPAFSCMDILDAGDSTGDGYYWIDPEKSGNPLKVFCDMTTYGGGWLLISNIVSQTTSPPFKVPSNNSYRGIASGQMVLSKTAMAQLQAILPFTQLRFHCRKQKGRTFHVSTAANSSGEAVVNYFAGQTDVQPSACLSFVRMKDDNSKLAQVCNKWGLEGPWYEVGKWGHNRIEDRLYDYPAFASGTSHWLIHGSYQLCDDLHTGNSGYLALTPGDDFWKIFVR
ncbi:uncharacterized protein [Montipora capricornis]|uniref:uncharacterized protein n=1 Tax=Montipora capricornis TaxID=246305 RepID=UPI0035F1D157